jgi:hypothetical protein
VSLEFQQNTAASVWTLDPSAYLPFGGWARFVTGLIAEGAIKDGSGNKRYDMPYVSTLQGSAKSQVTLSWPVATQGKVMVTTRVDNPN